MTKVTRGANPTTCSWWFVLNALVVGLLMFAEGFFLTRLELSDESTCDDLPRDWGSDVRSPGVSGRCWGRRRFQKLMMFIIDAHRFDFVAPALDELGSSRTAYHNNMLHSTAAIEDAGRGRLFRFFSDPPTVTMQRLKGLMGGSMPTFLDVRDNFASPAMSEDNLIAQAAKQGRWQAMVGDDTWAALFPTQFNASVPTESFNVRDLHSVDDTVLAALLPAMQEEGEGALGPWAVLVGHCLGVDHAGHRYTPDHPAMTAKLQQMDQAVLRTVAATDDDTLLLVFGDHGMTPDGNHGGGTPAETTAALQMYSRSRPLFASQALAELGCRAEDGTTGHASGVELAEEQLEAWARDLLSQQQGTVGLPPPGHRAELALRLLRAKEANATLRTLLDQPPTRRPPSAWWQASPLVSQVDMTPTLALLTGLPIPHNSIGALMPDVLYEEPIEAVEGLLGEPLAGASAVTPAQVAGQCQVLRAAFDRSHALHARINAWQVMRFLERYAEVAPSFAAGDVATLRRQYDRALLTTQEMIDAMAALQLSRSVDDDGLVALLAPVAEEEARLNAAQELATAATHQLRTFLHDAGRLCREEWTQFDLLDIARGLVMLAFCGVFLAWCVLAAAQKLPEEEPTVLFNLLSGWVLPLGLLLLWSGFDAGFFWAGAARLLRSATGWACGGAGSAAACAAAEAACEAVCCTCDQVPPAFAQLSIAGVVPEAAKSTVAGRAVGFVLDHPSFAMGVFGVIPWNWQLSTAWNHMSSFRWASPAIPAGAVAAFVAGAAVLVRCAGLWSNSFIQQEQAVALGLLQVCLLAGWVGALRSRAPMIRTTGAFVAAAVAARLAVAVADQSQEVLPSTVTAVHTLLPGLALVVWSFLHAGQLLVGAEAARAGPAQALLGGATTAAWMATYGLLHLIGGAGTLVVLVTWAGRSRGVLVAAEEADAIWRCILQCAPLPLVAFFAARRCLRSPPSVENGKVKAQDPSSSQQAEEQPTDNAPELPSKAAATDAAPEPPATLRRRAVGDAHHEESASQPQEPVLTKSFSTPPAWLGLVVQRALGPILPAVYEMTGSGAALSWLQALGSRQWGTLELPSAWAGSPAALARQRAYTAAFHGAPASSLDVSAAGWAALSVAVPPLLLVLGPRAPLSLSLMLVHVSSLLYATDMWLSGLIINVTGVLGPGPSALRPSERAAWALGSTSRIAIWYGVSLSLVLVLFWHATDHDASFSALQYPAAFVGFSSFDLVRSALMLGANTFFPVVVVLVALGGAAIGAGGRLGRVLQLEVDARLPPRVRRDQVILPWYGDVVRSVVICCSVLALTNSAAFAAFARRHLMVWAVFAPKVVFEAAFAVIVTAVLAVACS